MDTGLVKQLTQLSAINKTERRKKFNEFESFCMTQEQVEIPVKHYKIGGMYAREITIPADTVLTGQIYKHEHIDIMVRGDITVSTDCGEIKRISGFHVLKGASGKKRAGYAHEDTQWLTIHYAPFPESDGDDIQNLLTADTFADYDHFAACRDRIDFAKYIESLSLTVDDIQADMDATPYIESDEIEVRESAIHGKGAFAITSYHAGDEIGLATIDGEKTELSRFANHSKDANCLATLKNGNIAFIASKNISISDEFTVNYRQMNRVKEGAKCQA